MCVLSRFNGVQLFATLRTVAPHPSPAPGFSVHGILQAWILEWIVMPSSKGSFQSRDWTHISRGSYITGGMFTLSHLGSPTTRKCLSIYFSTSPSGSSLRKVRVILVLAWSAHNKHSIWCSDESFCFLNKLRMKEWMPCSYWEFTK